MNAETFCEHFATFADAPEGIKKLRHLILQLAVQGKLTTRETTDHPVKDLRGEMESARQRMIGAGTIRHGDQFTPVSAEETPYSLPENWTWVRIGEVMHLINGKAFKPTDWLTSGLPIVRIQNLNNPDAPFNYAGEDVDDKVRLQNDDFLISWSGTPGTSFGAFIWDRGPAVLNQHIFRAILYGKAFIKPFLKLAVNARLDEMIAQAHGGVGLQHITKGKLERLSLPLAPLAEQSRIVAKVDQLLALCDELAARQAAQRQKRQRLVGATLDRLVSTRSPAEFPTHTHRLRNHFDQLFDTPTTIPQLRQTILQLALQGQLVPVRRNEEVTAETLLAMERERMSLSFASGDQPKLESEYAALRAAGPNQDGSRRYISARCICDFITKGTTPAASELMPQGDVPFLKVYNIVKNVLNFEYKPTFVRKIVHETELRRSKIQPGNVLMNLVGPPLGKVAVVTEEYPEWNCNQALVIFKPISFYDSKFLSYIIGCPATLKEILQDTRGTAGQDNISLEQSRNLRIPLVSLEYQRRFIAEVTELLSLCDALEAKLTQAESAGTQLLSAAVHSLLQN